MMSFKQVPTVIGIRDFEFPTKDSVENRITAFYHNKVGCFLPNNQVLTSTIESLLVESDIGWSFFWTAHKDKRFIARKFKSYR